MITWIVLRAAGIGAYVMLFGAVTWGLIGTSSVLGRSVAKATAVAVHQFLSTVALALLGVHLALLLVDRFVPFGPLDLVVPMHSAFRPMATAFGIVAMYGAVVVLASSWVRKHLGTKRWRQLHLLAVPAFILAMVHGVFTGTDTVRPWMWWIYASTGAVVLFLLVVRGLTANIRPTRAGPPDSRHPVRRQKVEGNGSAIPTPAAVATAAFPDPTRRRLEPSRP